MSASCEQKAPADQHAVSQSSGVVGNSCSKGRQPNSLHVLATERALYPGSQADSAEFRLLRHHVHQPGHGTRPDLVHK